jgi:hypothetical protein
VENKPKERLSHHKINIIALGAILSMLFLCLLLITGARAIQSKVPGGGQFEIDWNWQHGYRLLALVQTVALFSYNTEGHIRGVIARPYYDEMYRLRRQGDLKGALRSCAQFESIVSTYSGIGSRFYECQGIQQEIQCADDPCAPLCGDDSTCQPQE